MPTCFSGVRSLDNIRPITWKARPVADRLWEKIEVGPDWECWPRSGAHNSKGYGHLDVQGITLDAHRLVWEYTYGPIPDGLRVLHHCDNPPCCNPEHLFLGTDLDNVRDMDAKGRRRNAKTAKTRCPKNHPYSGDNLYINPKGARVCRICTRESHRESRKK
jgi:hypothetical protein